MKANSSRYRYFWFASLARPSIAYYCPGGSSISNVNYGGGRGTSFSCTQIAEVIETNEKGDTNYGTVNSIDPNAYPENGEQDGYWYVKAV